MRQDRRHYRLDDAIRTYQSQQGGEIALAGWRCRVESGRGFARWRCLLGERKSLATRTWTRQGMPTEGRICLGMRQELPSEGRIELFNRAFQGWHGTSYAFSRLECSSVHSRLNRKSTYQHIRIFEYET